MTKTFVEIKTNYEFFHKWENAPEEVSFLRNLHRHIFYVTVKMEVFHNDRDIEFFMLKNDINKIIDDLKKTWPETISCEQMAIDIRIILKQKYSFRINRFTSIKISEDNENSAIVEEV